MPFLKTRRQIIIALVTLTVLITAIALFLTIKNKPFIPSQPAKISSDLKKGLYKCPSTKDFCKNGKDIIKDKTYAGFGADVATGSAVLASFDGIATGLTITLPKEFKSEKLNLIYLDSKQNNTRATYYFKGSPINFNEKSVKEGQVLGKVEERMNFYNTFLLFTIIKGDPSKGEKIRLTSQNFIN